MISPSRLRDCFYIVIFVAHVAGSLIRPSAHNGIECDHKNMEACVPRATSGLPKSHQHFGRYMSHIL